MINVASDGNCKLLARVSTDSRRLRDSQIGTSPLKCSNRVVAVFEDCIKHVLAIGSIRDFKGEVSVARCGLQPKV